MTKQRHLPHEDKNIAFHHEWGFRKEALLWEGERPIAPNLFPSADELRRWMLRQGQFSFITDQHRKQPNSYTNPYLYDYSSLVCVLAVTINDAHAIAIRTDPQDPEEAEIQRIRITNEHVLNIARICEALTKQLLYCTNIDSRNYKKAALGALLSTNCRGCADSGKKKHKISLLGSLAHRYNLCNEFENCLHEHLRIVNTRRNSRASHASSPILDIRSASESRDQLMTELDDLGNELVHMLEHISKLEKLIMQELTASVESQLTNSLWDPTPLHRRSPP